ncbi:5-formyltetrahydrofolate cyclo-ligase [Pelagibius sp. CAU 1746]|uniref:5-formyltetrahydrofolate cyclo-ligase n=1 Tax=Pelagibius sp. CAU 1746 TaxID=3140370 RepID=UPI00325B1068
MSKAPPVRAWDEVRSWRRETRGALLARRSSIPRGERLFLRPLIGGQIHLQFPELRHACIGFYWPIKAEIDLRHLVRDFVSLGAEAALPVVVEKNRPVEFWAWRPRMKMSRGFWNIPVPAERHPVRPTALLVPLVGFDEGGYRLGYGGGYYDRTLAALDPRPLTIGVGYACGRLATISPQPHDIPLDAIVTEAGVTRHRYRGVPLTPAGVSGGGQGPASGTAGGSYASPPCSMHELDPSYLGYMSREETLSLLNELLEGERAGARVLAEMGREAREAAERATLRDVAMDEARFCAMLSRHVRRLGGSPSAAVGAFHGKVLALDAPAERLTLLNRGQGWVVRKLEEACARIADDELLHDLREMQRVHAHNIARCEELVPPPGG